MRWSERVRAGVRMSGSIATLAIFVPRPSIPTTVGRSRVQRTPREPREPRGSRDRGRHPGLRGLRRLRRHPPRRLYLSSIKTPGPQELTFCLFSPPYGRLLLLFVRTPRPRARIIPRTRAPPPSRGRPPGARGAGAGAGGYDRSGKRMQIEELRRSTGRGSPLPLRRHPSDFPPRSYLPNLPRAVASPPVRPNFAPPDLLWPSF